MTHTNYRVLAAAGGWEAPLGLVLELSSPSSAVVEAAAKDLRLTDQTSSQVRPNTARGRISAVFFLSAVFSLAATPEGL